MKSVSREGAGSCDALVPATAGSMEDENRRALSDRSVLDEPASGFQHSTAR